MSSIDYLPACRRSRQNPEDIRPSERKLLRSDALEDDLDPFLSFALHLRLGEKLLIQSSLPATFCFTRGLN